MWWVYISPGANSRDQCSRCCRQMIMIRVGQLFKNHAVTDILFGCAADRASTPASPLNPPSNLTTPATVARPDQTVPACPRHRNSVPKLLRLDPSPGPRLDQSPPPRSPFQHHQSAHPPKSFQLNSSYPDLPHGHSFTTSTPSSQI